MFDITQFRDNIVTPSLELIQMRSECMVELLVFTCAIESAGGTYVKQKNGPALGIYQIEPATFTDLWVNYISRKPDIVNLLSLNCNVHRMPEPHEVMWDLRIASICTALLYRYKKVTPTQKDEDYLWDLYKTHYNTPGGAAEKDPSLKLYRKFIKV